MDILKKAFKNLNQCRIKENGLIIKENTYNKNETIQFKSPKSKNYTLEQVVFYLLNKDLSYSEYLTRCNENFIAPVSYVDKDSIIDELKEKEEAKYKLEDPSNIYLCNKDFSYVLDIMDNIEARIKGISSGTKNYKIIVPSSISSLITMNNIEHFMREKIVEEASLEENLNCPADVKFTIGNYNYQAFDDVNMFTSEDWQDTIAIFLDGSKWQFKSWQNKSITELFFSIPTFLVRYNNKERSKNIEGFNVYDVVIDFDSKIPNSEDIKRMWNLIMKKIGNLNKL